MPGLVRRRAIATVAASLIATAALPVTVHADDEPPTFVDAGVSPASLPSQGGTVTISAEVVDEDGITDVSATVSSPDGGADGVTLSPTGPSTFSATYAIGPNFSDSPVSWTIEIWATDTTGEQSFTILGLEVDAQPQFDEPPVVWDPTLTPTALPPEGGTVSIGVRAWDLRGVTAAYATVTTAGGAAEAVELVPVSADRFEGTFVAPPNAATTAQTYAVTATAQDDIGQETTVEVGSFSVAAAPPPAAQPGRLAVNPLQCIVGPTPAGRASQHAIVIRNTSGPGTAPVDATIVVTGGAFRLASTSIVQLAAGARTTATVAFTPSRAGLVLGTLTVRRADGLRPIGCLLVGVGARR